MSSRLIAIGSGLAVLALLAPVAVLTASAAPPRARPVSAVATVEEPFIGQQPTPTLFTIGHARLYAECGGAPDSEGQVGVKVVFEAVGGTITWSTTPEGQGVLQDGETDSHLVLVSPAGVLNAATMAFAVYDDDGPSFSGTVGARLNENSCVVTAQAAGATPASG